MPERILRPRQVADILGYGLNTVYGMLTAGDAFPHAYRAPGPRSTGRKPAPWRIPESDVRQHIADRQAETERASRSVA